MNSKVVHIGQGKDTLSKLPKPPVYLTDSGKVHYKKMGKYLIKLDRLKESFMPALEIYAEAMAQFEFAIREIKKKNRKDFGTGYIQVFKSGASNISTEITLKNNAEATLLKCFKQFGLDPRSEKELKVDTNQLAFGFEELKKSLNS